MLLLHYLILVALIRAYYRADLGRLGATTACRPRNRPLYGRLRVQALALLVCGGRGTLGINVSVSIF